VSHPPSERQRNSHDWRASGGRHLVRAGKTTGDLFTSMLRLFGLPATSFGFAGDSDLNTGGIPGLG
jgi:hypothetical protein